MREYFKKPLIIVILTALLAGFYMTYYLSTELRGNINFFMLPAKMFGVPKALVEKGITPLYAGSASGWDGQFYYYMSNDLLGLKDTAQHIDSPSYRYQRIGLPLLANIISKITFQTWVSPFTYYLTYLAIILLATFYLARYYYQENRSPYLALFWSCSLGVQLTLTNALPDGAADAFLILSALAFLNRRHFFYILFITLSALSREAYILVAGTILLLTAGLNWREDGFKSLLTKHLSKLLLYTLPCVIFVAWQAYIILHFHATPSSEAGGILNWPFASLGYYFFHALFTTHNKKEVIFLILFTVLTATGIFLAVKANFNKLLSTEKRIVIFSIIPQLLLYTAFGHTVMFDYTGYMKTASVLLFFIPFVYVMQNKKMGKLLFCILVFTTLLSIQSLFTRINAGPNHIVDTARPSGQFSCLNHYSAKLEVLSVTPLYKQDIWRRLYHSQDYGSHNVRLTNTSSQVFPSAQNGSGMVNIGYQYNDPQTGQVLQDGGRTPLPYDLLPGQSVDLDLWVESPTPLAKGSILIISPVQEGCAWFYRQNPASATSLIISDKNNYDIHSWQLIK